jgi:cation transport ATPase
MPSARSLYLALALCGAALPLYFFIPFLLENGLDLPLFLRALWANAVSRFFAMDVLVSAAVTIAFTLIESRRIGMRHGPWCLLGLCVGVSLALPLFLWLRQRHLETQSAAAHQAAAA